MKNWSKTKKIVVGLLVVLLVAQAIQPRKNLGDNAGPAAITQVSAVPTDVVSILEKSCYDCHSNRTAYPWYDNITPVNWWVANHVNEGKKELNFSTFGEYSPKKKAKKMDEIAETVEEGEMPLESYLIMHGDAKLTASQRRILIDWAKAEMSKLPPVEKD